MEGMIVQHLNIRPCKRKNTAALFNNFVITSKLDLKHLFQNFIFLVLLSCEERLCNGQHCWDTKQQKVTRSLGKSSRGACTHKIYMCVYTSAHTNTCIFKTNISI